MVLQKCNLSRLTLIEGGQIVKSTLKDLETKGIDLNTDVNVKGYASQLVAELVIYDKGLLQTQKNDETREIERLDSLRDTDLAIYRRKFRAFSLTKNAQERDAYTKLNNLWSVYKNITKLNYEAQSNAVDNLVQDLRSAKYSSLVTFLDLDDYVEEIKTSNEAFKDKYSTRSTEESEEEKINMKLVRKNTMTLYNNLINYVLTMAKVEPAPATYYTPMLSTINTVRKNFADIIARRDGGEDNG
ncbi:DUF6261 family protein [Flavobacterium sp. j3]|uniref:DUF6261 family protein n=1 Tax=Flavobacterium aureirubrum TaxID=3133147 RepID=A0ABU9MZX5_9FLAO